MAQAAVIDEFSGLAGVYSQIVGAEGPSESEKQSLFAASARFAVLTPTTSSTANPNTTTNPIAFLFTSAPSCSHAPTA